MESAVQHGAAAFVAGLPATGAEGKPAQARGAWRCGKRSAFPTSPHPRRRLRTNFKRGATLTIYLVQKIGQVSSTTKNLSRYRLATTSRYLHLRDCRRDSREHLNQRGIDANGPARQLQTYSSRPAAQADRKSVV